MGTKTVVLTAGTTWTVPADWTDAGSTITVVGGGGGGRRQAANSGGGGGGGGAAFAKVSAIGLTPNSTVYINIGSGGSGGTSNATSGSDGGDTWLNKTSNAAPTSTADGALAKGGLGATSATGASGGSSASSVGTSKYSGGSGGTAGAGTRNGGAGGGSSGTDGANGYTGGGTSTTSGHGGGGGAGTTSDGNSNSTTTGGNGGTGSGGTAGGTGGNGTFGGSGSSGSGGGGGGGRSQNNQAAYNGGLGSGDPSLAYGGGGGGGGGNANNTGTTGGNGFNGAYGGGGGGGGNAATTSGNGGRGGDGVITITYTAIDVLYWVGGSGTWDTTTTGNWALTSGGTATSLAPASITDVIFDSGSDSGSTFAVTLGSGATAPVCQSIKVYSPDYSFSFTTGNTIKVYGVTDKTSSYTIYFFGTNLFTGTPIFESVYSGSGTRYFTSPSSGVSFDLSVTAGSGTNYFIGIFNNLNMTGSTGSFTMQGNVYITGDFTLASGNSYSPGTSTLNFGAVSGTKTITTNNVNMSGGIYINQTAGNAATWSFASNFTSSAAIYFYEGTINANTYNLSMDSFQSLGAASKTIDFGSGTWTISGTSFNMAGSGTNTFLGTGTVKFTSTGVVSISLRNSILPSTQTIELAGASGVFNVGFGGNATIGTLTNSVRPITVKFPVSTTTTFSNFNLTGTSGNLVTIASVAAGNKYTLSKASGTVSGAYLSISDSTATGGATWNAGTGSVDGGNNSGWIFSAPAVVGAFFQLFF